MATGQCCQWGVSSALRPTCVLAAFPDILVVPCTHCINTSMTSSAVRESPNKDSCIRESPLLTVVIFPMMTAFFKVVPRLTWLPSIRKWLPLTIRLHSCRQTAPYTSVGGGGSALVTAPHLLLCVPLGEDTAREGCHSTTTQLQKGKRGAAVTESVRQLLQIA